MAAQILHIITLLAFVTHAVMGCCAHHAHAAVTACCGTSIETPLVPPRDAHEHDVTSHHCHGHAHNVAHYPRRHVPHEHVSHEQDEVATTAPASDHDGDHGCCDEGRCSFLTGGRTASPSMDLSNLAPTVGETSRVIDLLVGGNTAWEPPPICGRGISSLRRCADSQSWQI